MDTGVVAVGTCEINGETVTLYRPEQEPPQTDDTPLAELMEAAGFSEAVTAVLRAAGLNTVADIARLEETPITIPGEIARFKTLGDVAGIGEEKARKIKQALNGTLTTRRNPVARRRKQRHLPGMEPPSIKAIEKAAETYVDVRDRRMELTKEETDAQLNLVAVMREHKLDTYDFDGQIVTLVSKTKAKVKTKDGEEEGDAEADED